MAADTDPSGRDLILHTSPTQTVPLACIPGLFVAINVVVIRVQWGAVDLAPTYWHAILARDKGS